MYETKNFTEKTDTMMKCPCCNKGGLSVATLILLETIREHYKLPVHITSGSRCQTHNKDVGGTKHSEHLIDPNTNTSDAADIFIEGVTQTALATYIKSLPYANLLGVSRYKDFVHVDTRGYGARW